MADVADVVNTLKTIVTAILYPPVITLTGSITANDVITITATPRRGTPIVFSYTAQAGDTLVSAAAALLVAFQNLMGLGSDNLGSVNGGALTLSLVGGPWTITGQVSGAATEIVTVTSVPANGVSPVASVIATIEAGTPNQADLDALVTAQNASPSVSSIIVPIYPRRGSYRNTSRYPSKWQIQTFPTATLTAAVSGTTATVGGAAPGSSGPVQNVALIVGFTGGGVKEAFTYQTTPSDTLNSIATALAALVNAATPATATGPVISIPAAFSITMRIGVIGTAARELRRQCEIFDVTIWAPLPGLRDQAGSPLRQALDRLDSAAGGSGLVLPDLFSARIQPCGDFWMDDPEKAGLFCRLLAFDIDYPTTETMAASEIIVFEASTQAGQVTLGTAPTVVFPI